MNNIKNIAETVINDASTGKVKYYFDGKEHPFVQLNASGAGNDPDAEIVLKGNANMSIRELVGLFDASNGGAAWSSDGSWTNSEPSYALDASAIWNEAKELVKETVVSTGEYVSMSKYAEPPEIKEQSTKVFFPSMGEYKTNQVVAGKVYNACNGPVWSRSVLTSYGTWYVGNPTGVMTYGYSMIDALSCAPAFNLDLSKILMARSSDSDENVLYKDKHKLISYKDYCETCTDAVKFLAMTDNVNLEANVIKKSDKYIALVYKTTADNTHTYLSAIITDKDGKILYYNALKRIPLMCGEEPAIISLPGNLPEGYKVGVFREVRNDAYYTDTCSEIVWLDV